MTTAPRETIAAPEEGRLTHETIPAPARRKILEILTERTWVKAPRNILAFRRKDYCLALAIHAADHGVIFVHTWDEHRTCYQTFCEVDKTIRVLFPERVRGVPPAHVIATFNDHPDTTFEDVRRVCKVAGV